ncbi:MAG: hypothetical protein U0002_07980 [Thermoanaerobaculia bacterium]
MRFGFISIFALCLLFASSPATRAETPAQSFTLPTGSSAGETNALVRFAPDGAGHLLATWVWLDATGEHSEIRARRLGPNGQPLGPVFRVDAPGAGQVSTPEIAASATGSFAIAWRRFETGDASDASTVEARLFRATGEPAGAPFRVPADPATYAQAHRLAMAPGGRLAIVWLESESFVFGYRSFLVRFFDAAGRPLGAAREVVPSHTNSQDSNSSVSLAFGADGSLLTAWRHSDNATIFGGRQPAEVWARRFDPAGNAVSEPFRLNEEPRKGLLLPELAAHPDGGYLAIWQGCPEFTTAGTQQIPCSIRGRRLGEDGHASGPELELEPATGGEMVAELRGTFDALGRLGLAASRCAQVEVAPLLGIPDGEQCDAVLVRHRQDLGVDSLPLRAGLDTEAFLASPTLAAVLDGFTLGFTREIAGEIGVAADTRANDLPFPACSGVDPDELCLTTEDRFAVLVRWRDHQNHTGRGQALPLRQDSGGFWFFNAGAAELIVKVLDARTLNQAWWVFFGSLSDVEYSVTVVDTQARRLRTYLNPEGRLASFADTAAFVETSAASPAAPAEPRAGTGGGGGCASGDPGRLCLAEGRFEVQVAWQLPDGQSGIGTAASLSDASGTFTFFGPENIELLVKILDGRELNGHWWVFYGALSNVAYQLTVVDHATGQTQVYGNPAGTMASAADTSTF